MAKFLPDEQQKKLGTKMNPIYFLAGGLKSEKVLEYEPNPSRCSVIYEDENMIVFVSDYPVGQINFWSKKGPQTTVEVVAKENGFVINSDCGYCGGSEATFQGSIFIARTKEYK